MKNTLHQKILKELNYLLKEESKGLTGDKILELAGELAEFLDQTYVTDNQLTQALTKLTEIEKTYGPAGVFKVAQKYQEVSGTSPADGLTSIGNEVDDVDEYTNQARLLKIKIKNILARANSWRAGGTEPASSSPAPQSPTGGGGGATGGDTTPPSGDGTISSKSVRCTDDSVFVYQQWLKYIHGYTNLVVDGAYGKNTHAAAKKVFNEPKDLEQVKQEVCRFARAKKAEWVEQLRSKIPADKIGKPESQSGGAASKRRKTSAAPQSVKTPTANYVNINVKPQQLIDLGFTGRFIKNDPAKLDTEMQKVSVDPQLLTVLEQGTDYQLLESYNFHDKLKVNKAEIIYETLIKKWI